MGESRRDYDYTIKKMYVYPEKGADSIQVEELVFLEGKGIRGDFHADGGERQISLLTEDKKRWMEEQKIKGFCFRKYKENILLEVNSSSEAAENGKEITICSGDLLEMGEAVLEVTESLKTCHPELCRLAQTGKSCLLAGGHSFAKVRKGGIAETGMTVKINRR